MNITLIIVVILFILLLLRGYKKGMTRELNSLISLAVTMVVVSLIIMLYTSFMADEIKNTVFTIVLLVGIALVYSVIKFLLRSLKLLSRLPMIKFADKLLGAAVGVLEAVFAVWIIFIINEINLFGPASEIIRADIYSSELLSKLYQSNFIHQLFF